MPLFPDSQDTNDDDSVDDDDDDDDDVTCFLPQGGKSILVRSIT